MHGQFVAADQVAVQVHEGFVVHQAPGTGPRFDPGMAGAALAFCKRAFGVGTVVDRLFESVDDFFGQRVFDDRESVALQAFVPPLELVGGEFVAVAEIRFLCM